MTASTSASRAIAAAKLPAARKLMFWKFARTPSKLGPEVTQSHFLAEDPPAAMSLDEPAWQDFRTTYSIDSSSEASAEFLAGVTESSSFDAASNSCMG